MDNETRNAAIEQALAKHMLHNSIQTAPAFHYKSGFIAGAASVDRKEIVREAFAEVQRTYGGFGEAADVLDAMDAVLETIGEGE